MTRLLIFRFDLFAGSYYTKLISAFLKFDVVNVLSILDNIYPCGWFLRVDTAFMRKSRHLPLKVIADFT